MWRGGGIYIVKYLKFADSHNIFRTKGCKSVHDITSCPTLILNRGSFSCSSLVASFGEYSVGRQPRTAMKNFDSKGTVTHFPTCLSLSEVFLPVLLPHFVQIQMSYSSSKRSPPAGWRSQAGPESQKNSCFTPCKN